MIYDSTVIGSDLTMSGITRPKPVNRAGIKGYLQMWSRGKMPEGCAFTYSGVKLLTINVHVGYIVVTSATNVVSDHVLALLNFV